VFRPIRIAPLLGPLPTPPSRGEEGRSALRNFIAACEQFRLLQCKERKEGPYLFGVLPASCRHSETMRDRTICRQDAARSLAACSKTSGSPREGTRPTRFPRKSRCIVAPVPSPGGFFNGLLDFTFKPPLERGAIPIKMPPLPSPLPRRKGRETRSSAETMKGNKVHSPICDSPAAVVSRSFNSELRNKG